MKLKHRTSCAVTVLGIFTLAAACNVQKSSNSETTSTAQETNISLNPDSYKYAGFVYFEGGTVHNYATSQNYETPLWRLYLCLEKTDTPVSGQFELDLQKLSAPIPQEFKHSLPVEFKETMPLVTINYDYTASLVNEIRSDGATRLQGKINISGDADEWWQITSYDDNFSYSALHNRFGMFDFDGVKIDSPFYTRKGLTEKTYSPMGPYSVYGQWYYLRSSVVETFADNKWDGARAEECEKRQESTFLVTGDEVSKASLK